MDVITNRALRILKLFVQRDVSRVSTRSGPGREYFLIDRDFSKAERKI